MSELCLDCYNRLHGTHHRPSQVILTAPSDVGVCSQCGEVHRLLMRIPSPTPWGWMECRYWKMMEYLEGESP